MQLSDRLLAVTKLVTPGNRVADVGCDHAYTSIFLVEQGISPYVIAMDVNQGPIDRARENIIRYGQKAYIDVRKSNGLEKLEPGEADTVLIAGMGGRLTLQILSDYPKVTASIRELVLQPQSEIHLVRRTLQDMGFLIVKENMLKEDGKYYVMMRAVPKVLIEDECPYVLTEDEHYYYGRQLLEQRNSVLVEYLEWEKELLENIVSTLSKETTENTDQRKKEIKDKLDLIKKGLGYYRY